MKKDYKKIMVIGSGPIVIGQAAEFDFSGSQACKSVREEGYKTVLVNSNPATIQTDVDMADSVYVEPLQADVIEKIIVKEGVDGILAGMGGQTALNICSELADKGVLEKHGVTLLGTQPEAIARSEDRELFKEAMEKGAPVLLEPIMKVEVTMPEEYMGDVIGDINSRRGRIEGMEDIGGGKMVKAYVPLSEMFGYSTDLRSRTQGRGNYSMFFEKYEQVPKNVQEKVLAAKSK